MVALVRIGDSYGYRMSWPSYAAGLPNLLDNRSSDYGFQAVALSPLPLGMDELVSCEGYLDGFDTLGSKR